ncbi:hypothetical protein [Phytohabitans rumicis]|uniref:hypothetical protein n=1 Tax=Phytohabitans rumicis TaxID=1076125 RepID=UPI003530BC93
MPMTDLPEPAWPTAPTPAAGGTPAVLPPPRWSPARLAYWFYTVAAAGAVIGQTWVAVTHIPWNSSLPTAARVAAVLPFALCLEMLAMALAAMADQRMRLGERAYGFRVFSTTVAAVAVGILIAGHWPHLYWSAGFGLLSAAAYLLWLLHAAARRRDALRATGKLADTAPDYGLWRRLRYPLSTARAAELARTGTHDPTEGGGRWACTSRWKPPNVPSGPTSDAQPSPRPSNRSSAPTRPTHSWPRSPSAPSTWTGSPPTSPTRSTTPRGRLGWPPPSPHYQQHRSSSGPAGRRMAVARPARRPAAMRIGQISPRTRPLTAGSHRWI